jgi:hypothetical protein
MEYWSDDDVMPNSTKDSHAAPPMDLQMEMVRAHSMVWIVHNYHVVILPTFASTADVSHPLVALVLVSKRRAE